MSNPIVAAQVGVDRLEADERERIDAVFEVWNRPDSPGVALGIYREGEIAYTRGYGMANLEHGIPIVPSSIFHLASISKQFAGFAIALLAHEGRLDVDADIRTWLPEVPELGHAITLRHLMQHTSGLRDQWVLLELAGWREEDLVTDADVLDLVSRQRALNFPPGERYLYSNTGYTLMSLIVRRVAGQSLRVFCQERIFGPLGMTRTHFHDDHSEIVPGRTQAYHPREGGGYRISIPEFDVAGATSLFSTVEDFFHWDAQFGTERLAPATVLEEFQRPGTTNDGESIDYGWGIAAGTHRGVTLVGHSGADHGYRSEYQRAPEHGLGVVVFANCSNIAPGLLARQVIDVLLADVLEPAANEAAPESDGDEAPLDLAPFAGIYRKAAEGATLLTRVKDGVLVSGEQKPMVLQWRHGTTFALADHPWLTITFGDDGATIAYPGSTVDLTRAAFEREDGETRTARAGRYRSDELGVMWEIAAGEAGLVVRRRKEAETPLIQVDAGVYVIEQAWGALELAFDAEGFLLSEGRVRNLRFTRD